eukprot:SAG22_NODE_1048_length_5851_cov_33.333449_5_plen_826_part_00
MPPPPRRKFFDIDNMLGAAPPPARSAPPPAEARSGTRSDRADKERRAPAALSSAGRTRSPADDLMDIMDTDGDGCISKEEFRAAFLGSPPPAEPHTGTGRAWKAEAAEAAEAEAEQAMLDAEELLDRHSCPGSRGEPAGAEDERRWAQAAPGAADTAARGESELEGEVDRAMAAAADLMEAASNPASSRGASRPGSPPKSPRHSTWRRHIAEAVAPEEEAAADPSTAASSRRTTPRAADAADAAGHSPGAAAAGSAGAKAGLVGKWVRIFYDDDDGSGGQEVAKVLGYDGPARTHELQFVSPAGQYRPGGSTVVPELGPGEYVPLPLPLVKQLEAANAKGVPAEFFDRSSVAASTTSTAHEPGSVAGPPARAAAGLRLSPAPAPLVAAPASALGIPPLHLDGSRAAPATAARAAAARAAAARAAAAPLPFSAQAPDAFAQELAARMASPPRRPAAQGDEGDEDDDEDDGEEPPPLPTQRIASFAELSAAQQRREEREAEQESNGEAARGLEQQREAAEAAEAVAALELAGLRMSELMRRATTAGVSVGALADAQDAADPKAAVVELLLSRGASGRRAVAAAAAPPASRLGDLADTEYMRRRTAAQSVALAADILPDASTAGERAARWPLRGSAAAATSEADADGAAGADAPSLPSTTSSRNGSGSGIGSGSAFMRSASGVLMSASSAGYSSPHKASPRLSTAVSRSHDVSAARVHNLLHHSQSSLLVSTTSNHVYPPRSTSSASEAPRRTASGSLGIRTSGGTVFETDGTGGDGSGDPLARDRCVVQDCNSGPLPLRMSSKSFPVCVLDHEGGGGRRCYGRHRVC